MSKIIVEDRTEQTNNINLEDGAVEIFATTLFSVSIYDGAAAKLSPEEILLAALVAGEDIKNYLAELDFVEPDRIEEICQQAKELGTKRKDTLNTTGAYDKMREMLKKAKELQEKKEPKKVKSGEN